MTCPNYNLPLFAQLRDLYGPGAANAVSALLDTPVWSAWYGAAFPELRNKTQIVNPAGEVFDVADFLRKRKALVAQENGIGESFASEEAAQRAADAFNQLNERSKQFEAVVRKDGDGFKTALNWRKEVATPTVPPIAFSQAPAAGMNTQQVTDSQRQHQSVLDKLRTDLQELIERKQRQVSKAASDKQAKYLAELEKLQKALGSLEQSQAITLVIDYVHAQLLGADGKKGVVEQVAERAQKIEQALADNTLSREQMLEHVTELRQFQQYVRDFGQLQNLYDLLEGSDGDPDSPKRKLDRIRREQEKLVKTYQQTVKPLMARMLSPYLSKKGAQSLLALKQKIQEIDGYLLKAQASGDKAAEAKLEKQKQTKLRQLRQNSGTEADLLEAMDAVTQDVGTLEYLLGSTAASADGLLATFTLFVKDAKVKLDQQMQRLGLEAQNALDAFRKATGRSLTNPAAFNEGIFEVRNVWRMVAGEWQRTQEVHFVEEVDYAAYDKARAEMQAATENLPEKQRDIQRAIWYSQNTQSKPQEEVNSILQKKEGLVAAGIWTQEEYTEWLNRNRRWNSVTKQYEHVRELGQPSLRKYANPAWQAIQADPAKKAYYEFLLAKHQEADALLPEALRLGTRLPNIRKSLTDKFLEKNGNVQDVWQRIKDSLSSDPMDEDLHYGAGGDVVPARFTGRSVAAADVSLDLMSSVLLYHHAAQEYQQNTQMLPFYESLKETVEERDILEVSGKGDTILRAGAKKLGLDVAKTRDGNTNNALSQLVAFGDTVFFGQKDVRQEFLGVDVGKALSLTMSLASKTQIGGPFNWPKQVANALAANISVALEAWAGEHFTTRAWLRGKKQAYNYLFNGDALQDFAKGQSTTLTGQLLDYWSPIPEGFRDQFGREISKDLVRRKLGSSAWFLGNKLGEMEAQYSMFFAMLGEVKLKQGSKTIPATEAYELDENNQLKLKDGVEWSQEEQRVFKNKLDALSTRLHGNYASFSQPAIAKTGIGKLLLMYKKFLEPAYQRRFGAYRVNQELDSEQEGYYRSFARSLMQDWKTALNALVTGQHEGTALTQREVNAARQSLRELVFTGVLFAVSQFLLGLGDDDKELKQDWVYQIAVYQTMRQASELMLYVPLLGGQDQLRVFSSPTALTTTFEKILKIGGQLITRLEEYEVRSKWHDKGDNKLVAQLQALIGYNNLDPSKVLDNYKRFFN